MAPGSQLFANLIWTPEELLRDVKGMEVESLGTVAAATVMDLLWAKMQRNTTGDMTRLQSRSGLAVLSRR